MDKALFTIGADGVDTDAIVREIQATVARKKDEGLYDDPRVARAERANLANLKNEADFLSVYLESLRDAAFVDINDFDIIERRRAASGFLVRVKRFIWKLLKFYTYRLWSQQNQINGLLLTAIEGVEESHRESLHKLESRLVRLEKQSNADG